MRGTGPWAVSIARQTRGPSRARVQSLCLGWVNCWGNGADSLVAVYSAGAAVYWRSCTPRTPCIVFTDSVSE